MPPGVACVPWLVGCLGEPHVALCPLTGYQHPPLVRISAESIYFRRQHLQMQGKRCEIQFCAMLTKEIEMWVFKNGLERLGRVCGAGAGPALPLAGPGAGSRPCVLWGCEQSQTHATSHAFLRAVRLCPAIVIASPLRLQTLHVNDRECLCLKPSASEACLRGECMGRRHILGRESPSLCLSPGSSPSSLDLHWDIHKYVVYC